MNLFLSQCFPVRLNCICSNIFFHDVVFLFQSVVISSEYDSMYLDFIVSATSADLTKALDDVEKLLQDLLGMGTLNITKLENAEKRFKIANDTIVGRLDVELEKLKEKSVSQLNQIKQYELDLGPLEKEIKHVEDIYKALPRKCMKPSPPPA